MNWIRWLRRTLGSFESRWSPVPSVSYAASVIYIHTPLHMKPEVFLVKTKKQEIPQKDGSLYQKESQWQFPGGQFDPLDHDLIDTAIREAMEEAGLIIAREELEKASRISHKGKSDRPGSEWHEVTTFLVVSECVPKFICSDDPSIVADGWFKLKSVLSVRRPIFWGVPMSYRHWLRIHFFKNDLPASVRKNISKGCFGNPILD